jgi:hypothetical protein
MTAQHDSHEELREAGIKLEAIAADLGIHRATVYRVLGKNSKRLAPRSIDREPHSAIGGRSRPSIIPIRYGREDDAAPTPGSREPEHGRSDRMISPLSDPPLRDLFRDEAGKSV